MNIKKIDQSYFKLHSTLDAKFATKKCKWFTISVKLQTIGEIFENSSDAFSL